MTRTAKMDAFIAQHGWEDAARMKIASDASHRSYVRLRQNGQSVMVMDAPPPHENAHAFVQVAQALCETGLSAPRIMAQDLKHGFLLLEDFGDMSLQKTLAAGGDVKEFFKKACETTIFLRRHYNASTWHFLSRYEMEHFHQEHGLLLEHHMPAWGLNVTDEATQEFFAIMEQLLKEALRQEKIPTMRDYHIDNLMWLKGRKGVKEVGLLDFQDALMGPACFDLVSLVDDVRYEVPYSLKEDCLAYYHAQFKDENFFDHAAILSLQRLLKIAGIFVRLERRDGKSQYRQFLPRTWHLIEDYLRRDIFTSLRGWFDTHLPHAMRHAPPPE